MEKIKFSRDGKSYEMTAEEIEAAYRYREHEYLLADAKRHMLEKIYDTDDPEAFTEAERQEAEESFKKIYGISAQDATAKEYLEAVVAKYEDWRDCNVAENATWETVINIML